jgi:starvation-inducible DNA-binding protein
MAIDADDRGSNSGGDGRCRTGSPAPLPAAPGNDDIVPAPRKPPPSLAKENLMSPTAVEKRRTAPLATPTDLKGNAIQDISGALAALLADTFAIYMKTKNFHWHMSGPHFRDYHLLLDEHADQIFAMTDELAERARKIGGTTLRSIGHIGRLQRINDNDADYVTPEDMLAELRDDNKQLVSLLRETHEVCAEHNDVATTSLLENWIDEAERRTWFLFEMTRQPK